jgi:solute:Na+ symporter, SSS family
LGFYYWTTNHVVVQKTLSAKNLDHGRWGVLLAGFMQLPFLFLLILPGVMGRVLYPDLTEPDQIWPALVFDFLPIGLKGLVFAALIAALMSTLDSVLNGAASLVVNDLVKTRKRWRFSDRQLLLLSRVMIGFFMVAAALWAPMILRFEGIVEYFQSFLGHITMPVVVVFLGGLFWPGATSHGAFYTMLIIFPVGFAAFLVGEVFGFYELQFLYATGLLLLLSSILFVAISLRTEPPEAAKVKQMCWSRRFWREESAELRGKPLWKSYRLQGMVLTVVTFIMIWIFR